jgi:hypothetical protein
VAEVLVTNFFCHFGVLQELYSDQGRNFESCLIQGFLQCLGMGKMRTTPLHPQSDGMVEHYIRMVKEDLWKVVTSHQRDWDTRLPIFLLAYRASTHVTTGLTPASLVWERTSTASWPAVLGSPNKEWPTIDHAANLVDHIHIHNYACQYLKLASDWI